MNGKYSIILLFFGSNSPQYIDVKCHIKKPKSSRACLTGYSGFTHTDTQTYTHTHTHKLMMVHTFLAGSVLRRLALRLAGSSPFIAGIIIPLARSAEKQTICICTYVCTVHTYVYVHYVILTNRTKMEITTLSFINLYTYPVYTHTA